MIEFKNKEQRALMDALPIAIVILSSEDRSVQWINNHAELWLQKSRLYFIGRPLSEIAEQSEKLVALTNRVIETRGAVIAEDVPVQRWDDPDTLCHVTAFPAGDDVALILRQHRRAGMAGNSDQDIDAVESLGRMLAHELKNPLAGIKGAAQLLSSEISSGEGRELISLITTETDRIHRLADRMEAFGTVAVESMGPVNIHTVLRQTRLLAQSMDGDIIFEEDYDPSLPDVMGNQDALMQVSLNLIKNAVEAIAHHKTGSQITLQTSYRAGVSRQDMDRLQALPVEIKFIDNGPGIPPHIRRQLFQPFVTDKPAGRGLGLTLVSKLVQAHGGMIEITSKPGRTIFSILLPTYHNEDL